MRIIKNFVLDKVRKVCYNNKAVGRKPESERYQEKFSKKFEKTLDKFLDLRYNSTCAVEERRWEISTEKPKKRKGPWKLNNEKKETRNDFE